MPNYARANAAKKVINEAVANLIKMSFLLEQILFPKGIDFKKNK